MSTTTKFTPGPWVRRSTYGREGKVFDWRIPVDAGPVCLGLIVQAGARSQAEAEANAALVAAAPELYACCEWLADFVEAVNEDRVTQDQRDLYSSMMVTVTTALAKARGEG